MLVYEGRYYLIGEGHKTYTAEKTLDEDYYILTLAAIAMKAAPTETALEISSKDRITAERNAEKAGNFLKNFF